MALDSIAAAYMTLGLSIALCYHAQGLIVGEPITTSSDGSWWRRAWLVAVFYCLFLVAWPWAIYILVKDRNR